MTDLVKVRFTRNVVERVHGYAHPLNPSFAAGNVYDLRQDSALHWLKRGAVELVNEEKAQEKADAVPVSASEPKPAPAADRVGGGDKPVADKPSPRKTIARNN